MLCCLAIVHERCPLLDKGASRWVRCGVVRYRHVR